jgi:hydrogenase maturation protein HypF
MREPWRNAFAHLERFIGWEEVAARYGDLEIVRQIGKRQVGVLTQMLKNGINAPLSSSAGRLFDAVAATLGVCPETTSYEGQAAIELEALAGRGAREAGAGYPIDIDASSPRIIGWASLWRALLDDLHTGVAREVIAARFHKGLAASLARLAVELARHQRFERIVLSGGVMQNRLLLEGIARAVRESGLEVLSPRRIPANDGGISLGQAVIAAARAVPPADGGD